jgi:hypothetical protein
VRILNFVAENFKRLQVVEITPDGALVDVKGKNAQGKSSVLDAIWAALGGKAAVPGEPIRKGEERARIELKLGEGEKVELIVKRTFARGSEPQIVVEAPDGARYAKPQTILDGLLGSLSFDPLAFTRMPAKAQVEQLRALVPDVDFEAIDGANKRDFDRRTEINREERSLRARFEAVKVPGDPRQQRVDETALVAELERAGQQLAEIERERARRASLHSQITARAEYAVDERADATRYRERIAELRAEIAQIEKMAAASEDSAAAAEQEVVTRKKEYLALPALDAPPDTASIKARIDAARRQNGEIDTRERVIQERAKLEEEAAAAKAKADALTAAIEKRNDTKAAAVKAANLPVDGLALGDEEVLYNGLPLSQAADSERLRVSIAIAAALNPKLRVIRVRDGSLLDDDGLKLLAEFAEKHGLQVWLERVASNATTGIILEDGRLKAATEEAA